MRFNEFYSKSKIKINDSFAEKKKKVQQITLPRAIWRKRSIFTFSKEIYVNNEEVFSSLHHRGH